MISLSLPLPSLPPQRQGRDTERSERDFSKWRQAGGHSVAVPGKGERAREEGPSESVASFWGWRGGHPERGEGRNGARHGD